MPKNADEFQDMMELVLYNPKTYTFHQRMRDALVRMQSQTMPSSRKVSMPFKVVLLFIATFYNYYVSTTVSWVCGHLVFELFPSLILQSNKIC